MKMSESSRAVGKKLQVNNKQTGSSNQSDGGTLMRVVGQLLEYLGSEESRNTFTIMTSNNASALPPELTRSGRIDTIWYFSMPTLVERKEIFKIHFGKTPIKVSDEVIEHAAESTQNYTGAEIKEIVQVAMRKAYKRFKKDNVAQITDEDIDLSIPEVIAVYESSKEKIGVLEEYYRTRARFSNTIPQEIEDDELDTSDIINFNIDV